MADTGGPRPSGIAGLLGQLFAYLDRPWKAVVVGALALIGVVAWTAYEHRGELLESWLTPDRVELKTEDVPAALDKLVEEAGADLVQIWSIDLNANSQRFVAARRKDGERPTIPSPRRLPVITGTSDVRSLVMVLDGSPVCVDVTGENPSPVARRLAERGMQYGCAVPIPPSPDAFVGVVYLTWLRQPDAAAQDAAVGAAREIAGKLATR